MKKFLSVIAAAGLAPVALADLFIDFEAPTYSGSAAGVSATGQDGWTLPSGVNSEIHEYVGNVRGLVQNPTGGRQFLGGRSQGGTNFARAQHLCDWSSDDRFVVGYDLAPNFDGVAPSAINLSSFSLQDSVTTRSYIALNNWIDNNNPSAGWKMEFNVFTAAGVALNNQVAFSGLAINHWYREITVFSFLTNMIEEVRLVDLTTNAVSVFNPVGWFLQGGANSTLPRPTGLRFFAGGAAGNIMGVDNLSVIPGPGALALVGVGLAFARRRRA